MLCLCVARVASVACVALVLCVAFAGTAPQTAHVQWKYEFSIHRVYPLDALL